MEQAKLKVISSKAIAQRVSDLVKLSKDVSRRSVSTTRVTFPRKMKGLMDRFTIRQADGWTDRQMDGGLH